MIARTPFKAPLKIGPESNGMLMTPEEFDAIEDYDDCYRYELIFGVLVVNEFVEAPVASASEFLGFLLFDCYDSPCSQQGRVVASLPGRYIATKTSRWRVDRVIWIGASPLWELCESVPLSQSTSCRLRAVVEWAITTSGGKSSPVPG